VEKLGAQRIEHGVRAVEDPAVLDLLCERGIALDVCPVSNVKLGVVPAADQHPIRRLIDAGIVCTISTDDPISFGQTLEDEYLLLAEKLSFTRDQLAGLAHNGFRVALASEDWKRATLATF
jgi:adenosine deaminase